MALNPVLYRLLMQEFGEVYINHDNEEMDRRYLPDYFSATPRVKLEVGEGGYGETYAVNCPYCGDTRHRLYVPHRWGVYDPTVGGYNLWMAKCFNEECLPDHDRSYELFRRIYVLKNVDQRRTPVEIMPGEQQEEELRVVDYPGDWFLLSDIGPEHPAYDYLLSRGVSEGVIERHKLAYCTLAKPQYRLAQDRIIIPIHMNQELVGWQCRYVGEADWKEEGIRKYYNMPNMPRRLMLYNFDRARKSPFVVLVEGAPSVWAIDDYAVGLLGKSIGSRQVDLVADNWSVAVVLMDGDKRGRDAAPKIAAKLQNRLPAVIVTLPDDKDPGDCEEEWLDSFIRSEALKQGFDLDAVQRKDPNANALQRQLVGQPVAGTGRTSQAGCAGGDSVESVDVPGLVSPGPARRSGYAAPRT